MPHIIVEHSAEIEEAVASALPKIHNALADLGPEKHKIKTRAIPLKNLVVGEEDGTRMAHLTLKVWDSPDRTDEKMMSWLETLVDVLAKELQPKSVITAELVRLNTATYVTKNI